MFSRHSALFVCPFSDEQVVDLPMQVIDSADLHGDERQGTILGPKLLLWGLHHPITFFSLPTGIDLTCMLGLATLESFRQPVVECIDARCLYVRRLLLLTSPKLSQGQPTSVNFDFLTVDVSELHNVCARFGLGLIKPDPHSLRVHI
jgi:hypothetical protein